MLTQVGKYQIVEKIGVGGFGSVYKGRDPFIKRAVAIKTCQSDEDEIKKRFFREAEFAGNLQHRNITTIYDFGVTDDGVPYIVQEFLTGEDLDKKIKRKEPLSLGRKARILLDVCEGLDFAHQSGIIHRDIKPSNIRILENGTVKIMDFGIAKSMVSQSTLTQTGITLGTASYLAPEQIRGEAVDPRTDVFSLGVLAYELLLSQKPFTGDHISTVLYKILNEVPPPPHEVDPSIPAAVGNAVMHALEKDRTKRPGSCAEFRDELAAGVPEGAEEIPPTVTRPSGLIPVTSVPHELEETISTPTGGVLQAPAKTPSGGVVTGASASVGATPISKAMTSRSVSVDSKDFTAHPATATPGSAVGDVHIRQQEDAHASAAAPGTGTSAPKVAVFVAVALVVGGAVAFFAMRGKRDAGATAVSEEPAAPKAAATTSGAPPTAVPQPTAAPEPTSAPTAPPAPTHAAPAAPAAPANGAAVVSANYYANVSIDGARRQGVLAAVKIGGLKPGRHRAVFETEGFPPLEKSFEVRSGESVEVRAEFPPRGQLQVQVNYEARDAEIRLDGEPIGKAPIKKTVRAGTHRVEAVLPGFETVTKTITVPEEDRYDLKIAMKKTGGAPAPATPPESGQ